MPWSDKAKRLALQAAFGGEGLTVGLITEDGAEEKDYAYRRQPVEMGMSGADEIASTSEVRFAAYSSDSRQAVTHWAIFDHLGEERVREELQGDPVTPREGFEPYFPAGALVARLP